jgi:phosphoribosylamine-glycine ligase
MFTARFRQEVALQNVKCSGKLYIKVDAQNLGKGVRVTQTKVRTQKYNSKWNYANLSTNGGHKHVLLFPSTKILPLFHAGHHKTLYTSSS